MALIYSNLKSLFDAIANAIRGYGSSAKIQPDNFPTMISNLTTVSNPITSATVSRGHQGWANKTLITGTGPVVQYSASAPSGLSQGDIWVQTSSTNVKPTNYSVSIGTQTQSVAFTEYYLYTAYSKTMSGTCSFSCSGSYSASGMSVSYSIPYTFADPGTYTDYNGVFYYTLQFIDTSGATTTIANSSVSVAHGGSGTITGSTTVSKVIGGYFRLTAYFAMTYINSWLSPSTTTTSTIQTTSTNYNSSSFAPSFYPVCPQGGYMISVKYNNQGSWI